MPIETNNKQTDRQTDRQTQHSRTTVQVRDRLFAKFYLGMIKNQKIFERLILSLLILIYLNKKMKKALRGDANTARWL